MKTTTIFGKTESLSERSKRKKQRKPRCFFLCSTQRNPPYEVYIKVYIFRHRFTFFYLFHAKSVTVLHSGVVILYATAGGYRRPHIARTCLKLRYTLRGGL